MPRLSSGLLLVVSLFACSDGASPPDAARDASTDVPARLDAPEDGARRDVGTDAGWSYWDGDSVPEPDWTVPSCASDFGVLYRAEVSSFDGSGLPGPTRLFALAAGVGRASVITSRTWFELTGAGPEALAVEEPLQGMQALHLTPDAIRAIRRGRTDEGLFTVFEAGKTSSSERPVTFDGPFEEALYGPTWRAHVRDSGELDLVGPLHPAGSDDTRLAAVLLDPSLEPAAEPRWLTDQASAFRFATDGTRSLLLNLLMPCERCETERRDAVGFELVPYNDASIGDSVVAHTGFDAPSELSVARDGSTVLAIWRAAEFADAPSQHWHATFELGSGAVQREPEMFDRWADGPVGLTSSPGGGYDLVRQPDNPDRTFFDELVNTNHPLEVYVGMQPPLSYEDHEPLQLGAGAFGWTVMTARDGDRLYVVWEEDGPMTERTEDEGWTFVQGLYWAVLEGCESTAR